jgi:hypothetical protein
MSGAITDTHIWLPRKKNYFHIEEEERGRGTEKTVE